MLGQIPKNWKSNVFQNFNFNKEIRIWEFNLPEFPEFPEFITLLEKLIPLQLPKTYLEGFKIAHQTCTAAFWPQDPKIIFTSNSYSTDDYFKIWAASKIENGTTLIIGQHGGNYGMAKWSFTEDHQIEISDYFLSWGWKDVNQMKIIPFGILKLINQKIAKVDLKSRALMVELVVPRYSYWMYSVPVGAGQWIKYIDDQHKFVSDLRFDIQEKLLIRLNQEDYNLRQANRWQDKFPHIELDNGEIPMAKLLIDTRLYISTYNATTYLESLAMNMPTIIFWNPNHWELREGIQPFFDLLKEVGIYHETPESAAKQINKIWGAIDNWWFDSRTQLARLKFCEKFAHSPEKPLDKLADLFKGLV
jgi:putative transferase (TIGR04331 family)